MSHNERCGLAKSKRCMCGCEGTKHGKQKLETKIHPNEVDVTGKGGEVGQLVAELLEQTFICHCGSDIICDTFLGYPHDNGLMDENEDRWWIYVRCETCNYDWAIWKIKRRIEHAKA